MASRSEASPPNQKEEAGLVDSPKVVLIPEGLDNEVTAAETPFALPGKGSLVPASNRDSRASFASTNRTSTADSVFSNGRISTFSVSTSVRPESVRQSSLDSGPPSAISPWETDKRKDSFDSAYPYFCTFCDLSFLSKLEWRTHELTSHGGDAEYPCRACGASYAQASSLATHLSEAHNTEAPYPAAAVAPLPEPKRAWGCGFCATTTCSHASYLDHIDHHFDEGKEREQWQQVLVIKALLQQPNLQGAWNTLLMEQEAARRVKLRFSWNDQDSLALQTILECFAPSTDNPKIVAELAYRAAEAKPETNISGQYSSHGDFSRVPRPHSGTPGRAKPSEDIVLSPENMNHDIASAFEEAALASARSFLALSSPAGQNISSTAPFSSHIAKKSAWSSSSTPKVLAKIEETPTAQLSPGSDTEMAQPESSKVCVETTRQGPLRRVESDWNLSLLRPGTGASSAGELGIIRPRTTSPYRTVGPPTESVSEEVNHHLGQILLLEAPSEPSADSHSVFEEWPTVLHAKTTSSRRTPSGSSFLSTHTLDHSRYNDNSASEYVSDDSLSEPDSWLEFNDKSESTRMWARVYHQKVERIMELLWARYNHDFDVLVNKCVGEQSNNYSQAGEPRGRAQNPTTSQYPTSYSLQPNVRRRISDEREDDEEMEGHRPTSSQSKRGSPSPKRYACPFRKHDPDVYNIHVHDICALRSWESVSRMKEHLYRKHCKIYCQRCKQTFRKTSELEAHEMRPEGCDVRRISPPADITAKQEKQLKSKKYATRYQTEEEKWAEVYRLLFPREPVPSPYPELAPDIRPVPPESRNNLNFQFFLLSEMPQIFRQTAATYHGRYIEDNESLPIESINAILKESINQAFQDWEASGGSVPRQFTPNSILQNPSITTSPSLPRTTQALPITNAEAAPPVCEPSLYEDFQQQQTFPYWQDQISTLPLEVPGIGPFENDLGVTGQQGFAPTTSYDMSGFQQGYSTGGGFGNDTWL